MAHNSLPVVRVGGNVVKIASGVVPKHTEDHKSCHIHTFLLVERSFGGALHGVASNKVVPHRLLFESMSVLMDNRPFHLECSTRSLFMPIGTAQGS
jgi:hypothetical protein